MNPPERTYYFTRKDLFYIPAFPSARIVVSGIDHLFESKDTSIELKKGVENHGIVALNLDQVDDAMEIDYCLRALEQSLEVLVVDEEELGVEEEELETLEFFIDRFSAERSICDEECVRAVVAAVRGVVRAARSPRVEGDDAAVKGAFGIARAVTKVFFAIVRAARSLHAAVAELARAGRSPGVEGEDTTAGLARAALGEVRAARERPVVLNIDHLLLQVASADGVADLFRATPPRPQGVWSTVRVLTVGGVARLADAVNVHYEVQRCCAEGWRAPQLKKLVHARSLDSHLILLNQKLKSAFSQGIIHEDGSMDFSRLKTVGEQGMKIVSLCNDEIYMFQSEVATLPDILCEIVAVADERLSPAQAEELRGLANSAMVIIRNIRAQQVLWQKVLRMLKKLRILCPKEDLLILPRCLQLMEEKAAGVKKRRILLSAECWAWRARGQSSSRECASPAAHRSFGGVERG